MPLKLILNFGHGKHENCVRILIFAVLVVFVFKIIDFPSWVYYKIKMINIILIVLVAL